MSWDARQRAMLAEMGLRVWTPALVAAAAPVAVEAPARPAPSESPKLPVAALQALPAALRQVPAQDPPERGARGPVIAQMGWEELRRSAAECRACGLCGGRSNSVFGVGQTTAQCLVVGEAPGEQEDAQGEPFAGQAAQLLGNMLRAIDLSPDPSPESGIAPERQVYLSAALKCRPPPGSTPGPDELQQCRPYLARQIELLRPRIIVAMGRLAVQTLLGSNEPLGRLRGRVHDYQGIPVIVSFPPSYLLRNLADKARAWEDLCLVRATLDGLASR
jgi:uracil-DNA glycosylase family 4